MRGAVIPVSLQVEETLGVRFIVPTSQMIHYDTTAVVKTGQREEEGGGRMVGVNG